MKTEVIVKQTYFVKNLHGENYFKKIHVRIFHENIKKKSQIYFSKAFFFFFFFFLNFRIISVM